MTTFMAISNSSSLIIIIETSAYVFRFSFYVQVFASDSAIIFLLNLKISNQTKNL